MTLQSSGAISLGNVQTEFTGSNPISISEYYRGGSYVGSTNTGVPTSGQISLSQFYGTSAASLHTMSGTLTYGDNRAIYTIYKDQTADWYTGYFSSVSVSQDVSYYLHGQAITEYNSGGSLTGTYTGGSGSLPIVAVNFYAGTGTASQYDANPAVTLALAMSGTVSNADSTFQDIAFSGTNGATYTRSSATYQVYTGGPNGLTLSIWTWQNPGNPGVSSSSTFTLRAFY